MCRSLLPFLLRGDLLPFIYTVTERYCTSKDGSSIEPGGGAKESGWIGDPATDNGREKLSSRRGYQLQGRGSSRHAPESDADTEVMNVNVLCGAESIVEYTREMVDFREQDDDYGRNLGELIRECSGCTLPTFDVDNAAKTATSVQYEGGLLVLTSRESNIGG